MWYRTELLIATNQGKIALIDIALIPDGWDVEKWMYYATAMKFGFINSFNEGKKGQQFPTATGPIDILAISKDKSEYLIIELKKGRTSDEVIGQIKRYMGYVKKEMSTDIQTVKGCVIALEDDKNLQYALHASPDIEFMKYQIKFDLIAS